MSGSILNLAEIHALVRHDATIAGGGGADSPVTVLKMDCEGCEWKALHQIVTETPELLTHVHTIILEMHLETQLQMTTSSDLKLLASFYDHYITRLGFRMAYLHEFGEHSRHQVHPVLVELGLHDNICCYEVILHRSLLL
jgi:hypothetical protein